MSPDAVTPAPVPAVLEVRVAPAQVDKMGVVPYRAYLGWFELGRAALLEARGKSLAALEAEGLRLPLLETFVRYRCPARCDELVRIHAEPAQVVPLAVTFSYRVVRGCDGELLAEGHSVHGCASSNGRRRRLPAALLILLRPAG